MDIFSPGGLANLLHVSGERGHRKRIFSKKAFESWESGEFENAIFSFKCASSMTYIP